MNNRQKIFQKVLLVRMGSAVLQKITHPRHCFPPYTLKYVEASLKNIGGYQVKLLDYILSGVDRRDLVSGTLNWCPDVIIISLEMYTFEDALAYAALVKKAKNILIIATGKEIPAGLKDKINFRDSFDVVLPGEAERAIVSLIERLSEGDSNAREEIGRFALYKEGNNEPLLEEDLDSLPFPDYTSDELRKYRILYPLRMYRKAVCGHVLSSRGCPENCIFCSSTTRASHGRNLRLRSAVNVVDELSHLMQRGVNMVAFDDDNFTGSERHVQGICEEIQRRKMDIKWIVQARVDNVSPAMLKAMKEAGCILLRFGIESGSRRIIRLLKKTGTGVDWPNRCREVFREAKRARIATLAFFIIANPTEAQEDIEESMQLAEELEPDVLQVHFFTPYPGSVSYNQFISQITKDNIFGMHQYIPAGHNLSMVDDNVLGYVQALFYKRIFLNPKFLFQHTVRYGMFYLYNKDTFYQLLKGARLLARSHG